MTRASFRLTILLGILCVLNNCLGDIENDDLLKSYEEYFNKQNSNFTYEDGILYNVERQKRNKMDSIARRIARTLTNKFSRASVTTGTSRYKIEITIKVKDKFDSKSFRLLKCTATLNDDAGTLTVEENQCDDGTSGGRSANEAADVSSELDYTQDETTELTTTDSNVGRQALNLDSEVQSDNAQINNSGEQFVAIPRPQSSVPCIGCSSLVDNNAPGVDALANLAIRHLNKHTPDISYKLKFIVQVERQVQIVNGVRYIITINASPSNCGETLVEDCSGVKTCKVSILEKPWLKIPNGKKFRAVLSNNCTEQWLFGDDGEELSTKDEDLINTDDDIIKAKNNVDVQASPNSERKLTKEELNDLEDQIIPTNQINRQKRDVKYKTEGIKVLDPKEVYLLELAIEAFHKYSSEEVLRIRVVYATEQLSAYNKITRIDFNVKALETTLPNETNDVHTRCHTRVSEKDKNKKSFYTYCAIMDHENSIIEVPASNPIWRPIAEEKLESDYGELLQFNEIIRVYDDVINDNVNIIFDTKSSTNNAYRCHLTIQGDPNIPLVCIAIELGPVKKKEKDPTDLKYLHLASLALKKYLIQAHITEPYIVAVVSHASQLDGPLTDIDIDFISVDFDFTLRCISQVQENEELHIKKILVNCAKIPQRYDYPPKVIINRNPLDRKYVRIAREALKKYYPYVNYSNESLQIVYANEQVAGGVITRLDLDLNEERTATVHRCHVKLFEKVWENVSELSIDCFPKAQNIAGGRFEENASDPINWALARESLSKKYNSSLSLLEVVRLTTTSNGNSDTDFYAVSDSDKEVYQCHSSKLDQPWNKVSELKVECKPKHAKHIPISDGIVETDPSNPKYRAIAIVALAKEQLAYSNESLRVVYANEQIVSGVITRFDFDVREENNLTVYRCHVKLFEKAWEHVRELNIDCFPKAQNLPGGKLEQNASNPKNWELARESLSKKYNSSLSLLEVVRLTTAADGNSDTDYYAVSDSDKVYQCHSSIKLSALNVECKPKHTKHIPIPGEIIERDPSNPRYKAIAIEALAKVLQAYINKSLRVVYANEQIVRGVITRFDFDVTEGNNLTVYRCHVKLFEKAWEDVRDLNIDCFPKAENLPGGRFEKNASDPKNWVLAIKSLARKYNSSLSLLEVLRLTTTADGHFDTDFYAVSDSDKEVYQCHSSKLDQPWNKVSESKVECKPKYAKQIPIGGIVEKDPSNPKYKAIAIEALAKKLPAYSNESLRVVYANEQIVSGVITRFDFDVTEENNFTVYRCHVKLFEKAWEHVRELNIDCFPKAQNLPGGKLEQNASNPKNWELARESLSKKYNSSLSLLEVLRLTTTADGHFDTDFYAVSDSDKEVYQCHSSKLDQPWNKVSELKVECKPKHAKQIPTGGIVEKDPSNPKYKAIAIEALAKKLPAYSNESLRVVYANEQLVSGLITRFDFDVAEKNNFTVYRCHVKLFEKAWEHVRDLYIDCFPKAENLPGGRFEENASDPRNWELARESLSRKYNSSLSLLEVVRLTTTADGHFKTDFYAVSDSDKIVLQCHSSILDQPWNNVSESKVECKSGIIVTDPTNPKYKAIAIEALAKEPLVYSNESLRVVYSNEQSANGLITRFDFDVAEKYNFTVFRCHVKLFEKPWKHIRDLNIDCFPKALNLPGGRFEQNASDPRNWHDARNSLANQFDTYLSLVDVLRVTTRDENGGIHETDFKAISISNNVLYRCHNIVFTKAWEKLKGTELICHPVLQKNVNSALINGIVKKDPSDPKFYDLARKSLTQYLAKANNSKPYRVALVTQVSEQVSEAVSINIHFIAVLDDHRDIFKCFSNIWEESFVNRKVIKVHCSSLLPKARNKRMPGGKQNRDPKNPIYLLLAKKALRQYLNTDSVETQYRIIIEEVTTTVVNGLSTDINFTAIAFDKSGLHYRCLSNILEQGWVNTIVINVNCIVVPPVLRKKRHVQIVGGKTPQNPNDPKYLALARQSLRKYLKGEDISAYQIIVEKVTTQVVAGIITDIDFLAKSQTSPSGLKCRSEILERLWENSTKINVDCSPDRPVGRKKRYDKLIGGKTPQDPNNPKYLALARQSLRKYLKGEDISAYQITVEKVTTQVVAGIITDIEFLAKSQTSPSGLKCRSEILERVWENSTTINVDCSPDRPVGRKKRYDKLIGGKTPQDPNNPKYLALARQSLQKYLKGEDISAYQITVEKVTTQVVAGIITDIDFLAKSQTSPSGLKCRSEIFERVWENSTKTKVDCSPDQPVLRKKRHVQIVGGKTPQNPNDPKYLALARQSLQKYLKGEDISAYQIIVEKVTTQVVAGIITDIDFLAKSQTSPSGLKCRSEILERLWENSTKINVDCSPDRPVGRKKRYDKLIGGKTPQDPNNPKYLALARQSLRKYLKGEDISAYQITVEKVTTQVVAGIITDIEFLAKSQTSPSGLKCRSEILERVWENSTTINVDCSPDRPVGRKKRYDKLIGGKTPQDPNNPKYLALARQSLQKYLKGEDISAYQITVEKVTTQVVAGIITDIDFLAKSQTSPSGLKCRSEIFERVWENSTKTKVDCSPDQPLGRKKRHDKLIGGKTPQDPNDPKYLALAKKSFSQYQKEGPDIQYQITVEQVTTTPVSGLLTEIYYVAVEKDGFASLTCYTKIWEQLWLNSTKIDVECNPLPREERSVHDLLQDNEEIIKRDLRDASRLKRSIGSTKILNDESLDPINNEDLIKADYYANEALKHIDAMYRHPRQMKVISIFSFTKDPKEHASAHYRIKMEVGYTNCLALSPTVGSCSFVTDMGASKFCRVSIWLQPDRDHPPRFKVSCDIDENEIETNKKAQAEQLFFDFLVAHKPTYLNNFEEMKSRLEMFKRNIEKIHELNTHERGTARYGVSKFTDLNEEEFSNKYLGLKPHLASSNSMTSQATIPNVALPASFDWREKGAVTEVKNQGACGSCWAFSVTGNIEGQWKLKSGQLVSLSEQELVDCDTLDQGCNGGLPDNAYRAIEQLGGLETEQDYPYEMEKDKCSFNKTMSKVQISGAVNITSNETSMAMWMVEHGPISIGINANAMQFYMGGVSHPWKALCNPKNLDHGVLIVGFGIKEYPLFKKSLPYWIVKNSWGPSWGEQGYYRIYRGDGSCGVNQMASSAIIN